MKNSPAKFLLKNSKGYPDFIMTMLVAVILCLFIVLLFWMMLNLLGLHLLSSPNASTDMVNSVANLLSNFNEHSQIIIVGICSSVFSLAATYYLRRSAFDKHYVEKKRLENEISQEHSTLEHSTVENSTLEHGLVGNNQSSIGHPNFDDDEEDI